MPDGRPLLRAVTITFDEPTHDALREMCRDEHLSVTALVEAVSRMLVAEPRPRWAAKAVRDAGRIAWDRNNRP